MRYLPLTDKDRREMLDCLQIDKQDDLYQDIPAKAKFDGEFDLDNHKTEPQVINILKKLQAKNISSNQYPFFIGAGCYKHDIPAAVDYTIQRSEFLTAYTPYQPEISQGTLAVIFEFQSFICNLTGMDVANASMYDGATSLVEAILMASRINKKKSNIVIANKLNPDYRKVIDGYIKQDLISTNIEDIDENTATVIVQTPDFYGAPYSLEELRAKCDEVGALLITCVTEIVSLGLLPAPEQSDIVVGEAQSLGVAMNFGGPHLGFFACKKQYVRQMPGRICGVTVDKDNKRGFVLTLNAREQHIRRQKATSNICSNQGLNVVAFTAHMALLGEGGFKKLAKLNHYKAKKLKDALAEIPGIEIVNKNYFNEFAYKIPSNAEKFLKAMLDNGIFAGIAIDENTILTTATETVSDSDIDLYVENARKTL